MQSNSIIPHYGERPMEEGHIRFVCLSDTHNKAGSLKIPPGDVILHSGDFSGMGEPKEIETFERFLSSLPHRHKIVIAGNHDITFDLDNQASLKINFSNLKNFDFANTKCILKSCIYLEDSSCMIGNYKIYGSPWTPTFYDWGFNLERGEPIATKWRMIPRDTEILLTHGPPYRILDRCSDGFNAGCQDLLEKINEIKPLVHLFGHIHEAYGISHNEHTVFINASNCTLRYKPDNLPIVFDLPIKG